MTSLLGAPVLVVPTLEDVHIATSRMVSDLAAQFTDPFIVVSGGANVPRVVRKLAETWTRLDKPTFLMSDERWSLDPDQSNVLELRRQLANTQFGSVQIIGPQVGGDINTAAVAWSGQLSTSAVPSIAVIALGDDGHIASIFAGVGVESLDYRVAICRRSPKPPPVRLTLTAEYLRSIPHRIVVAPGKSKAATLRTIADGTALPVTAFAPTQWMVDNDAASYLVV